MKLNYPRFCTCVLLPLLSFLLAFPACKRAEEKRIQPLQSLSHLQLAYGRSAGYASMYRLLAGQAEKERKSQTAQLFLAVARSEEIRAERHAELLRMYGVEPQNPTKAAVNIGTTAQTLRLALSSEDLQFYNLYPDLIRTAEIEGDSLIAARCRIARQVDARHRELFFDEINGVNDRKKIQYVVCSGCGYILTSGSTADCPLCHPEKRAAEGV